MTRANTPGMIIKIIGLKGENFLKKIANARKYYFDRFGKLPTLVHVHPLDIPLDWSLGLPKGLLQINNYTYQLKEYEIVLNCTIKRYEIWLGLK